MASTVLDRELLLRAACGRGLMTQEQIAAAAQLSPRLVWNAFNEKSVSLPSVVKLANAVGVDDPASLFATDGGEGDGPGRVFWGDETRELPEGKQLQEAKTVIADPATGQRLLSLREAPTFAEAVQASVAYTPLDDAHKDYPFLPGSKHNHFLNVATVVTLEHQKQRFRLGYQRQSRKGLPDFVHTSGFSILFAASFVKSVMHCRRTVMDRWLRLLDRDPRRARTEFLHGKDATIFKLIKYRLDLAGLPTVVAPLGIITNDQRGGATKRVYTSYVVETRLKIRDHDLDAFVAKLAAPGIALGFVDDQRDPTKVLVNDKGVPLSMDVVAWQAMASERKTLKFGSARFRRGFAVC